MPNLKQFLQWGRSEMKRYVSIAEPYGTWVVWDELKGEPAILNNGILAGLTQRQADAARKALERIDQQFANKIHLSAADS